MIILLGLPKSGTTSFTMLLNDLKICNKVYHWRKDKEYIGKIINDNKLKNKPLLDGFTKNDCITQFDVCLSKELNFWPQIHDFKQLYYENPDSIFILNKRDPNKIFKSFKKWFEYDKRIFKYNPRLFKTLDEKGFVDFVLNHYNDVESFFESKPKSKFISFDIENDDIKKLNKYIYTSEFKMLPRKRINNTHQTKEVNYKLMDEYKKKYIKYKEKYLEIKKILERKKNT